MFNITASASQPPEGTKRQILHLLLREELSSSSIAEALDLTPAAVRQHLAVLQAAGLVQRRRVPSGASRPVEMYSVTRSGLANFPKSYDRLLLLLVEVLDEREGPETLADTVRAAARRLARNARGALARRREKDAVTRLEHWLESEFAWEADGSAADNDRRRLVVHQCPFQAVSATRPEVCGTFFAALISELSGRRPVIHTPGEPNACCAFTISCPAAGPDGTS